MLTYMHNKNYQLEHSPCLWNLRCNNEMIIIKRCNNNLRIQNN